MVILGGWRGKWCEGASLPCFLASLNLGRRSTQECAGSLMRNFRFQMPRPEEEVRVLLKEEERGSHCCFGVSTVNEC